MKYHIATMGSSWIDLKFCSTNLGKYEWVKFKNITKRIDLVEFNTVSEAGFLSDYIADKTQEYRSNIYVLENTVLASIKDMLKKHKVTNISILTVEPITPSYFFDWSSSNRALRLNKKIWGDKVFKLA